MLSPELTTFSFPVLNVGVRVFLKCLHSEPRISVRVLFKGLLFKSLFYISTTNNTEDVKLLSQGRYIVFTLRNMTSLNHVCWTKVLQLTTQPVH